eukprot:g1474.t1
MDLGCSTVEPLALDAFNQWTTAIEEIWEKHGHIHERATLQYSKLIAEHGLSNMQEYFEENLENAVRKTAPPGFVSPNRIIGGNGRRGGAVKDQPFEDEGAGKGRGKQKQGGEDGEIDRAGGNWPHSSIAGIERFDDQVEGKSVGTNLKREEDDDDHVTEKHVEVTEEDARVVVEGASPQHSNPMIRHHGVIWKGKDIFDEIEDKVQSARMQQQKDRDAAVMQNDLLQRVKAKEAELRLQREKVNAVNAVKTKVDKEGYEPPRARQTRPRGSSMHSRFHGHRRVFSDVFDKGLASPFVPPQN